MTGKMRRKSAAAATAFMLACSGCLAAYAESSAEGVSGGEGNHVSAQLGSWNSGGTDASSLAGDDYDYNCALFVTADGIREDGSNASRLQGGTWDAAGASGITLSDEASGHTGILVSNAPYVISGAELSLLTDADGSDTCDFSGKGSAVAAFGEAAEVTVEDSVIRTSGVATMPVFADAGAVVTITGSTLASEGGTLYKDYMNTPDQGLMVAPPWILGIMGTSRCTNLMGTGTVMNVLDSETSAGAWAVLSTDAGENMALNVYNSSLTLTHADESKYLLQEEGGEIYETKDNPYTENYGSGYGTYAIGNAAETFAGDDINVGTYAAIFTGGSAVYTALEAGEDYPLADASGNVTGTYSAAEDRATQIHSDTFGFMAHQGTNRIVLEKGTEVESGYATFLVKTGASNEALTAAVDDARIENGGVLIQVMDNDDTTNGGMMDADDENNANGGSQNFKMVHTEDAGFFAGTAEAGSAVQSFTFTNGTYMGNIYNASGSDGLSGSALYVTLGEGAVLEGGAAQTSAVHVTYEGSKALKEGGSAAFDDESEAAAFAEEYQNTSFDITEYYSIGQVANQIHDNSANAVYMTLTDGAVWNVTGTSLISGLAISGDSQVVIPEGVTLTVGGVDYTDCVLTAEDEIAAGVAEPAGLSDENDGMQGGMDQGGPGGDGQEPPEMPGGMGQGGPGGDGQEPPEMPGGMGQGGPGGDGQEPPEMPGGMGQGGSGGDGQMPGAQDGAGGGTAEGDMANANASVNTAGVIAVTDGNAAYNSDEESLAAAVSEKDGQVIISNLALSSGNYSCTGISVSGSDVVIEDAGLLLGVEEDIEGTEAAGAGVYTDSGTTLIEDSSIQVDGAGRYTVAAENDAELIVKDSVIASGGDNGADGHTAAVEEPFSNKGLLISGTSRANFSVGQSHTWYYDSLVTADGWAALSTDSATGSGLEFVACGTEALALNGGYGLYADTNCRDYLYGSTILSAEVGVIISNNGSVTVGSMEDAQDAVTEDGNEVLRYADADTGEDAGAGEDADTGEDADEDSDEDDSAAADGRTIITAGRNAFMLHSPDMMGEGNSDYSAKLSISGADISTDSTINGDGLLYTSAVDGEEYRILSSEDYREKYGDAIGAYIEYVTGAAILVKSTSADILIKDASIETSGGAAVLAALNSDSMSRYLKEDVGNGVHVTIEASSVRGSLVHDDYQRDFDITLSGTELSGAVSYVSAEEWNARWEAYAEDENCTWYGLDPDTYVTGLHSTALTLSDGSVWNVTGESRLTTLTVSADSEVNGRIEAEGQEELEDGTVVYTDVTVAPLS